MNDSGNSLPDAVWLGSPQVRVIDTNQRNRSVARNTGAAVAKGKYLHFLDDDDWILPGALQSLSDLATDSHAAWISGAFRLVDNYGKTVADIYPEEKGNCFLQLIAREWLPLQASLIDTEVFFTVGGFASLESLFGGFEDIDLSRQIARHYEIACSKEKIACIRAGLETSTTNYADMFLQNRRSREKALNLSGAFTRMRESASENSYQASYWHGKIGYLYLASIKWLVLRRRFFPTISRCVYCIASVIAAGNHIATADYWRGVLTRHKTRVDISLQESTVGDLYQLNGEN